jgi:hypothetical protein
MHLSAVAGLVAAVAAGAAVTVADSAGPPRVTLSVVGIPVADAPARIAPRARLRGERHVRRFSVTFGDGTRRRGSTLPGSLVHRYERAGRYRVSLTVVDSARQSGRGSVVVTVRTAPPPPPPPTTTPPPPVPPTAPPAPMAGAAALVR